MSRYRAVLGAAQMASAALCGTLFLVLWVLGGDHNWLRDAYLASCVLCGWLSLWWMIESLFQRSEAEREERARRRMA